MEHAKASSILNYTVSYLSLKKKDIKFFEDAPNNETLLNDDFTFKKKEEILDIFSQKGVVFNNYIITSCGSGVTAAVLYLALDEIGCTKISLYDGSWAEWGKI